MIQEWFDRLLQDICTIYLSLEILSIMVIFETTAREQIVNQLIKTYSNVKSSSSTRNVPKIGRRR